MGTKWPPCLTMYHLCQSPTPQVNPKRHNVKKKGGAGSRRAGANPQNSANTSVQHVIRWHGQTKQEVDIKLVTLLDCVCLTAGVMLIFQVHHTTKQHKKETTSSKPSFTIWFQFCLKTSSYSETSSVQCARCIRDTHDNDMTKTMIPGTGIKQAHKGAGRAQA